MSQARHHFEPARIAASAGLVAAFLLLPAGPLSAANIGIVNSPHDLSFSSTGPVKAAREKEVCIFCHIPHHSLDQGPLWNHALSSATYIPYYSSTLKATVGQPTGSSKLCLSCHDGTVALGQLKSTNFTVQLQNSVTTMPAADNLGTDLSKSHPISFTFDAVLAAADSTLVDPASLKGPVRLDSTKQVQCTSCHDPHNDQFGSFLVVDNSNPTNLCLYCHSMVGWGTSVHALSAKTWKGAGINPWPDSKKGSVASHSCQNCHLPHGAGSKTRLLRFAADEMNCLSCHSGTLAAKNIAADLNKVSAHPVFSTTGAHDAAEDPVNPGVRHSTCADCHDPHSSNAARGAAPLAAGSITRVKGVGVGGAVVTSVTREYELCFRCHADSNARGPATVSRQFPGNNTRLEFNPANASFHPVTGPGRAAVVPSLLSPYTPGSVIYCTDCHNSDSGPRAGGSGADGPHGSMYSPLLERRMTVMDFQPESYAEYALCYKCHNRDNILSDASFKAVNAQGASRGHRFHIVDQQTSCATCHDSHGVATQRHLINSTPFTCALPPPANSSTGASAPVRGTARSPAMGKTTPQRAIRC